MSFFSALIAPLVNFFLAYKWYFIIAILLYILLTTLFRSARGAITVVFGVLVLFFIISNIGSIFQGLNSLFSDLGHASEQVSTQYSQTITGEVLNEDDLTPGEKVTKATTIFLGMDESDGSGTNSGAAGNSIAAGGENPVLPASNLGFVGTLKRIGNIYAQEFYTLTHMR